MHIDYLIVGQGIAGTLISYELLQAGKSLIVIDDNSKHYSASTVAGALINPVAGRKWTITEEQELMYTFALSYYACLEQFLGTVLINRLPLYFFHSGEEQQALFLKQEKENAYLQHLDNYDHLSPYFCWQHGVGMVKEAGLVNAHILLTYWRKCLQQKGIFQKGIFDIQQLELLKNGGIRYRDIHAGKVIFCEGAAAQRNRFFKSLPFIANRGDVLILFIPTLASCAVYHYKDIRLIPLSNGLFWCGSNYKWNSPDREPDKDWANNTIQTLKQWLAVPFEVKEHKVAERPTTAGQFPFIGIHPDYPALAIFNGMGTRGFSATPFWAKSFAAYLCEETSCIEGYSTARFLECFKFS